MGSLTILRFHPLGEEPNLAKIIRKLMNTGRNRVHSFLTRGFRIEYGQKYLHQSHHHNFGTEVHILLIRLLTGASVRHQSNRLADQEYLRHRVQRVREATRATPQYSRGLHEKAGSIACGRISPWISRGVARGVEEGVDNSALPNASSAS